MPSRLFLNSVWEYFSKKNNSNVGHMTPLWRQCSRDQNVEILKNTSYLFLFQSYANFNESQSDCEKLKTTDISKLDRNHNFFFHGWVEEILNIVCAKSVS